MTTQDIKDYLFKQTGVAQSQWIRISKNKLPSGEYLRVFKDKASGKEIETLQAVDGTISIKNVSVLNHPDTPKDVEPIGYYQFDSEGFSVAIVEKKFWDKNQGLDGLGIGKIERLLSKDFCELSGPLYEFWCDIQEAKEKLEAIGLEEKQLFTE